MKNKNLKQRTGIATLIIYLIVFAIFNLFVFLLSKNRTPVFWLSYGFAVLAFIVQVSSMLMAFKKTDVQSVFMGIPLASLSFYYFFAAVFTAVVFMIFASAPMKIALLLQILIVAAYVVVAVLAITSRDIVEELNEDLTEQVAAVRTFRVDVDVLAAQVTDPGLKKALKKLSETVRFSDPISNDAVADIEQEIMSRMNELRICIESGGIKDAEEICRQMEVLFLQRNRLLKAVK